jgi:hypothetical protein
MSEEIKATGTEQPKAGNPTPPEAGQPQGKTWTDEYVQSLRGEAKDNRLKAKTYEKKLRDLIGLTDEDDLNDEKIEGYKTNRQKELDEIMSKANQKLLKAAVRALEGYDTKLLERLMDLNKVEYDEDGEPKNLKELAEETATEFPQVKADATPGQAGPKPGAANPPGAGTAKTPAQEYEDLKALVRANPYDSGLKLKLMKARERLIK